HILAIIGAKRDEIFVGRLQVRIQSWLFLAKTLRFFAAFEISSEVHQSENDNRHGANLLTRAVHERSESALENLPENSPLPLQTVIRLFELSPRTPPSPIDIVVPDRDQNQIGKPLREQ